ncbi:hypothetical protein [Desulfovibrio sp. TomC]|uniref:hypothetical protein n=1 Tax=Desulfovibrio sp. TomC TaxID=1562888 RepID=UPI00057405F9|nr:hypothetical protein [Desulfovibrio sp. TomC]KHK02945.1 hypothetical protein NY78_1474 [Desulfovibrio sp. TomC]
MNRLDFAFWFDSAGTKECPLNPVELHVNVWKLAGDKGQCSCIDFGILYNDVHAPQVLNLYVPDVGFAKEDFVDLFSSLSKRNWKVCEAVFNERLAVNVEPRTKFGFVTKASGNFYIYNIDVENNVSVVNNVFGGSRISIKIPSAHANGKKDADKIYVRFRLTGKAVCTCFHQDKLASSKWQNWTSSIELFDFRVNQVRTLSPSLVEEIPEGCQVEISTVQFFLMCNSTEELILSKNVQENARILEKDLWIDYCPNIKEMRDDSLVIAYQWRKVAKNEAGWMNDFSMFAKIKSEHLDWVKILQVTIFTMVLGILASYFASLLPSCVKQDTQRSQGADLQRLGVLSVPSVSQSHSGKSSDDKSLASTPINP